MSADKYPSNSAANWADAIWAESFRREFANFRYFALWMRSMFGLRAAGWGLKGKWKGECDE